MNSLRSNGVRNRTTHNPDGSTADDMAIAARMRRFNSVRVTACLACRFGTTKPNHNPVSGNSSTGSGDWGLISVDKSVLPSAAAAFFATAGRHGK